MRSNGSQRTSEKAEKAKFEFLGFSKVHIQSIEYPAREALGSIQEFTLHDASKACIKPLRV
jgi:hypothetical protein